jgi:dihydrofolate reductase
VKRTPLDHVLTDEQVALLTPFGIERRLEVGELLFDENATVEGKQENEVGTHLPGEFTGGFAVLTGKRSIHRARATSPSRVLEIDSKAFYRMAAQLPEVADVLISRRLHERDPEEVVSTTLKEPLGWDNSTLIGENVADEIAGPKRQTGGDISISGSGTFVQSLLKDGLIDELRLMVHPVVVGNGKRYFEEGGDHIALELVASRTFSTRVVYLTYQPAAR